MKQEGSKCEAGECGGMARELGEVRTKRDEARIKRGEMRTKRGEGRTKRGKARTKRGEAKIVWAYGIMDETKLRAVEETVNEFAKNDANTYFFPIKSMYHFNDEVGGDEK